MTSKIIYLICNITAYPLLFYVVTPWLMTFTVTSSDGISWGLSYFYSFIFLSLMFFICTLLLSRFLFSSVIFAVISPIASLILMQGIISFTDTRERNRIRVDVEYFESGELKKEREYNKEYHYQGSTTTYYKNGNIESVKTFRDNSLNGPFKEFYESGHLKAEGGMTGDGYGEPDSDTEWRFTGKCKFYFEDGSVDDIRIYNPETGLIVSSMNYKLFHDSGTIMNIDGHRPYTGLLDKTPVLGSHSFIPRLYTCNVIDGIPDGSHTEYYRHGKDSVSIAATAFYKNGLRDGELKAYYENGQLQAELNYSEGEISGEYVSYYVDEVCMPERSHGQIKFTSGYVGGKRQGIARWYSESGVLTGEESYDAGKLNGAAQKYNLETGKLTRERNYKNGVQDGIEREYNKDSGILESETEYVNGEQHGIERIYYRDTGKLIVEREYKNDKQDGTMRLYDHETGIIYKEVEYRNDRQDGIERRYDSKTGELIGESVWKDGSPVTVKQYNEDE